MAFEVTLLNQRFQLNRGTAVRQRQFIDASRITLAAVVSTNWWLADQTLTLPFRVSDFDFGGDAFFLRSIEAPDLRFAPRLDIQRCIQRRENFGGSIEIPTLQAGQRYQLVDFPSSLYGDSCLASFR